MVNETILAVIIAFAISAALCPVVIPFLHKLKFGQQVRDDGPQAHLKKQGTPTMGGLIILAAILVSFLLVGALSDIYTILMIVSTVWLGLIGFLDDYIKGDKYFKINSPQHNIVRTRCQIALAKDMQKKMNAMNAIVRDCWMRYRGK